MIRVASGRARLEAHAAEMQERSGRQEIFRFYKRRHWRDFYQGVYAPNYVRELASICAKVRRAA
jgi:hypothetical protein